MRLIRNGKTGRRRERIDDWGMRGTESIIFISSLKGIQGLCQVVEYGINVVVGCI